MFHVNAHKALITQCESCKATVGAMNIKQEEQSQLLDVSSYILVQAFLFDSQLPLQQLLVLQAVCSDHCQLL